MVSSVYVCYAVISVYLTLSSVCILSFAILSFQSVFLSCLFNLTEACTHGIILHRILRFRWARGTQAFGLNLALIQNVTPYLLNMDRMVSARVFSPDAAARHMFTMPHIHDPTCLRPHMFMTPHVHDPTCSRPHKFTTKRIHEQIPCIFADSIFGGSGSKTAMTLRSYGARAARLRFPSHSYRIFHHIHRRRNNLEIWGKMTLVWHKIYGADI